MKDAQAPDNLAPRRQLIKGMVQGLGAAATLGVAAASGAVGANPGPGCKTAARLFIDRFCTTGPALDNDNGNIWHTESLGVSLLAAVEVMDERLFSLLEQDVRMIRRPDGLHSWKVLQGKVVDRNNATDGDIFIAWAYLQAAQRFSASAAGLLATAQQTMEAIVRHCVRESPNGLVLLPGVEGFTQPNGAVRTINLSYWVYPALQAFARQDPQGPWNVLIESGRRITGYAYFGEHGLPPDWLELSKPVRPDVKLSTRFSYDAMRIPLYLHLAGYDQDPVVARCLKFFAQKQKTWVDLQSGQLSPYGLDPSAEVVLRQLRSRRGQTPILKALPLKYYPASLAVLGDMNICG